MGGESAATKDETKKKEEEKPKIFVGFARLYVVDSDGLTRKTNGSCIEAPLHLRRAGSDGESGDFVFSAHFPPKDPIHLLKVTSEQSSYLCGLSWMGPCGKHDEPPSPNRTLLVLEATPCSKLDDEASSCTVTGHLPFLPSCYDHSIPVLLTLRSERFTCRVTSMSFELSQEVYEKWTMYFDSLKAFDKDKDGDKKNGDDAKEDKK